MDRNVGAPRQRADAARILQRRRKFDIPMRHRDRAQVDLGAGHRGQQRDAVVDPGIGVDDRGDGRHQGLALSARV
jgi:hypothetical protein